MICNKCGFQLDEHDQFCSGCGAKVEMENKTKDVPSIDKKANNNAEESTQLRAKSWKKAIVALVTIISVTLIVLIFMQIQNKQPEAQQKQIEAQLADVTLEDAVAAAKSLRTSGDGTDIAVLSDAEKRVFHLTQYALLVNAIANVQIASTEGLQYWINDADMDGSPELFLEACFSKNSWRSSQLTADADSSVMWGYTATGAAGDSDYSFGQRDETVYFSDGYGSVGFGSNTLHTWNGESWVAFCEDTWEYQNGEEAPVHKYTWKNSTVSQQEYETNRQNMLLEFSIPTATDLYNIDVKGDAPELILDYEKYLQQNTNGYLGVAFADVDGDGKQEAVFFIENATKKWWDGLTFENSWGDESCLSFMDYGDSAVLAEVTDTGITLSAMKLPNFGEPIDTVYADHNELIVKASDIGYRVFANGNPNAISSPCLSYEIAGVKVDEYIESSLVSSGATTLSSSDVTIPPNQRVGDKFVVRGMIRSNNLILSVTVSVYDSAGNPETTKTMSLNTYEFNLKDIDEYILFDYLAAGNKTYEVKATDEIGTKILVTSSFTVN